MVYPMTPGAATGTPPPGVGPFHSNSVFFTGVPTGPGGPLAGCPLCLAALQQGQRTCIKARWAQRCQHPACGRPIIPHDCVGQLPAHCGSGWAHALCAVTALEAAPQSSSPGLPVQQPRSSSAGTTNPAEGPFWATFESSYGHPAVYMSRAVAKAKTKPNQPFPPTRAMWEFCRPADSLQEAVELFFSRNHRHLNVEVYR